MTEWVCKHCGGDNQWQNFEVEGTGWKSIDVSEVDGKVMAQAIGPIDYNLDYDHHPVNYECECGAEAHDIADLLVRAYDKCPSCKERVDEPNPWCHDHRPLYKPHPEQAAFSLDIANCIETNS